MFIMMESLQARSTEIWKEANLKAVEESHQRKMAGRKHTCSGAWPCRPPLQPKVRREKENERQKEEETWEQSHWNCSQSRSHKREITDFLTSQNFKFWHGKSHHKNQKANKKSEKNTCGWWQRLILLYKMASYKLVRKRWFSGFNPLISNKGGKEFDKSFTEEGKHTTVQKHISNKQTAN